MARPGPANSRRSHYCGDFLRKRQQDLKVSKSRRLMVTGLLCVLPTLSPALGAAQAYKTLATARAAVTPPMPYPGYLQPVTDAAFGTPFTRVTDPGRQMLPGISCKPAYCTHRYSSSQVWNADQSLLLIANGCSGLCFLDGSTYAPLFHRTIPNECEWHPVDPALMIGVSSSEIYTWNPGLGVRNINRPDWVIVTYSATYDEVTGQPGWAPLYQEVVALRIDGSGGLRRVIQTRNAKCHYWSETRASPSPDGSQIIWSSNWGQSGGPGRALRRAPVVAGVNDGGINNAPITGDDGWRVCHAQRPIGL
jgi:hypothetical protein